jgi:tetratricopeptide (TPR) repeat protein
VGGAGCLLILVTVAAWLARRRHPYFLFGWLWYVGMLVPVLGLLQFGVFSHADRFTYLPQIGVAVAVVWGAADLCRSWSYRRPACSVASLLVLTVLIGCAWRQASFWRDNETIWTHTLACTSRNKLAHNNLGNFLAERERPAEAVAHYRQALQIEPRYLDARFNLGVALSGLGRYEEAIAEYRQALILQPDFMLAHNNLGDVFSQQGRLDEAIVQYRSALDIQPDFVLALNGLAEVLGRRGRPNEAVSQYQKVLKIFPDHVEALKSLAWLLATCSDGAVRNGRQALELAERANRLCAGRRADVLDSLAAAYAEVGRFPEARTAAQDAMELARQSHARPLADALAARIALYEVGQPFHQPVATPASSRGENKNKGDSRHNSRTKEIGK